MSEFMNACDWNIGVPMLTRKSRSA